MHINIYSIVYNQTWFWVMNMEDNATADVAQFRIRSGSIHRELIDAVTYDDLKGVTELLDKGANPNVRNRNGNSLLFLAIGNNSKEVVDALLKHRALASAGGRRGDMLLEAAIEMANIDIVKLLLDAGVPINEYGRRDGQPLTLAYRYGLRDIFDLLVEKGASATTDLLLAAIARDDEKTVDVSITRGADVNTARDFRMHYEETPLHIAVRKGNVNVVKRILEAKPDLTLENMDDETAYDLAVKLGKKEIIELFEDSTMKHGGDYSKRGNPGFRPVKIDDTNFASVIGLEHVKSALNRDLIFPLNNPALAKEYGVAIKGGILLYGPPGCGKTFVTKALSGQAKMNIIEVKISDVMSAWVGEHEKNMRKVFESARKNAPCIVFFDEIEFLGGKREMHAREPWMRGGLNVLLGELDGLQSENSGILFIGSTNAPWMVDAALKRSGRLGKWIFVPPPDEGSRVALFKKYLSDAPLDAKIDYEELAGATKLCTSSDIAYLCREGVKTAWQRTVETGKKNKVTMQDMLACIKREKYNLGEWYDQAKQMLASESDKRLYSELADFISVYEAGIPTAAGQTYR